MLQGTLNDFSLPDVFSLLALTKKTGALRVSADATDGRVFFREGMVCLALSDANRVPLGARLVSAGLVGEDDLRAVVREHGGSSVAVTEALLRSGQVEDRVLGVYLREQIVDAVFELMRLEEGSFNFDTADPGLSRGANLSVTEVVAEATRRLEEWQSINRRIASPSAVLAMVPSATEGREGVSLVSEQWELLALIDGRRTVSEVVELTGKGEFATCRVLGDLVESGLVEAQDPATGGQTRLDKLIAAREALRSLEKVDKPGINPRLSAAAPVGTNGSAVRWIEPVKEEKPGEAVRPKVAPRGRVEEPQPAQQPTPAHAAPTPVADKPDEPSPDKHSPAEDPAAEKAPEKVAEPAIERPEPAVAAAPARMDRAQVARELASLGLDDDTPASPRPAGSTPRLTRDEELNKGLLLRLIDGVKGA